MNRLTKIVIGGVALIAIATAVSIFVIRPSSAHDQATVSTGTTTPSIVWNAPSISQTIKPGESKQAQVVLTAQSAVPAGTLRPVPELQPFLSVTPSTTPALAKGQTLAVTLSFSAKIDALPTTTTGTVQLRDSTSGATVSKPLPVTLNVAWLKTALAGGITVAYPPTLIATPQPQLNEVILSTVPLPSTTDTPSLSITFWPNPNNLSFLAFYADKDLEDADPYTAITVQGHTAYRLFYRESETTMIVVQTTIGFIEVDDAGGAYTSSGDLQHILDNIQF